MLGPLEVLGPAGWEMPSAAKRRQVLEMLALIPGERVSNARIVDAVWGDAAPSSASKIVQNHVLGLRKAYGPSLVMSVPGGYALATDDDATDAQRFERLGRAGRGALEAGGLTEAVCALDEALALWRGPPFPDLDGCAPALAEAARLGELRCSSVEHRLDALIASGEHANAIAALESAVAAEPLRERRWELLMVALYRSGRQAEALRAFQRARRCSSMSWASSRARRCAISTERSRHRTSRSACRQVWRRRPHRGSSSPRPVARRHSASRARTGIE